MPKLTFMLYNNNKDSVGQMVTKVWEEWIPLFHMDASKVPVRGKPEDTHDKAALEHHKNGPAVVLARINGLRRKENVQAVYAMSLDLDSIPEATMDNLLYVVLKPFEYIAHTTHKSMAAVVDGLMRLRVILPLDVAHGKAVHPKAWDALNTLVNGINDKQTRDACRLNYLPSTYDREKFRSIHNEGRFISYQDDLRSVSIITHEKAKPKFKVIEGGSLVYFDPLVRKAQGWLSTVKKIDKLYEPARALLAGQPLAGAGERHEAIRDLTWVLAHKYPTFGEEHIEALFAQSIASMQYVDPNSPGIESVFEAFQGAVNKAQADNPDFSDDKYTEDEIDQITKNENLTRAQMRKSWILTRGGSFFFLTPEGYTRAYKKDDAEMKMTQLLRRAPIKLFHHGERGYRLAEIKDLVREHGTVLEGITASMTAQKPKFDTKTETLMEASCPRRPIEPTFDKRLDEYYKILTRHRYETWINWLACFPDLTKQLCGVYFEGIAGSGKTLIAHGLGHIFTMGAPSDAESIFVREFNDSLSKCPLVFADEYLPRKNNRDTVSDVLRKMIGSSDHKLRRKYFDEADIKGNIRVILAANNTHLLSSEGHLTKDDVKAIADRILYIKVNEDAIGFLEDTPVSVKEHWLNEGIASHALWLMENHKVEQKHRFWVHGEIDDMHRILVMSTEQNAQVVEWLTRYTLNPKILEEKNCDYVLREEGRLFVNEQGMIDYWTVYISNQGNFRPLTHKVSEALKTVQKADKRVVRRIKGKEIRFVEIDPEYLFTYSLEYGIGSRETIEAHLQGVEVMHPWDQVDNSSDPNRPFKGIERTQ